MLARLFIALVKGYRRLLSPALNAFGPLCRFEPSCSRYALVCLEEHGALRGSLLSIVRLCKCHPFHPGGYDPPPLGPARVPPTRGLGPASSGASAAAERTRLPSRAG